MPFYDHDSDDPETTYLEFTAGEAGELGLIRSGEENVTVDLQKGERVKLYWHPDRAENGDE